MTLIEDIEETIVRLHKEGKGTKHIASKVHKNFSYVGAVLKKRFPEEYAEEAPVLTIETRALKLFSEGKTPVDVAILLNMKPEDTSSIYMKYLELKRMYGTAKILKEYGSQSKYLFKLLFELKKSGLGLKMAAAAIVNKSEIARAKKELTSVNSQINEALYDLAELKLQQTSLRTIGRSLPSNSWVI